MSLQRRLLWLLIAFTAFSLAATFGIVYAVLIHVESAMANLRQSDSESVWIEQLRVDARRECTFLAERVTGLRPPNDTSRISPEGFFEELTQVALFMLPKSSAAADDIVRLKGELVEAFAECDAALARAAAAERVGDPEQPDEDNAAIIKKSHARANEILRQRIHAKLLPTLDSKLQAVLATVDQSRSKSIDTVVSANTQLLVLALSIGVLGVVLVAVGTIFIRRWLLLPVRQLEAATHAYAEGNLDHRVELTSTDEFGRLGNALNEMAATLTRAQSDLRASEAKYRSLFNNLRDATLICDAQGRIIECQDGETGLLGRYAREGPGRSLLELWPTETTAGLDWPALIGRVLTKSERVHLTDIRLQRGDQNRGTATVNVIAFPAQLAEQAAVAIVLRDVTGQRQAERKLRRAEAMKATVTLARGVAHDFSGLLANAIGSLTILSSELANGRPSELVRRALRACGQAVGLSRTLLTFAGGERGTPEALSLRETVQLIIDSMDERLMEKITLDLELDDVAAWIDRDQFTEIVLNLVKNACEAMPEGGRLRVALEASRLPTAATGTGPATHALLTVSDTGSGIRPDVQERLFEPFFTTKARGSQRSRGMGLSVVYAAVNNAGGLIQVHGQEDKGATFQVWLPFPDRDDAARHTMPEQAAETANHSGSVSDNM